MKTTVPILAIALLIVLPVFALEDPTVRGDDDGRTRADETWTILSYISADSDLESELIGDLNELERVPDNADLNMVVQIDRHPEHDSSNGNWIDTRRYLVKHDETGEIASERIDDPELAEKNMDDPWTLKEFLTWGLTNYPADHYMITLHGHASGPANGLMDDWSSTLGGSKRMATEDMGWAIRSAIDETIKRKVDVISLDVCWMGMMEAAMEVSEHADYFVGSFDQIPAAGWPYDKCIPLIIDGSMTMEERLTNVVDGVMDEYAGRFSYVSLSALDLQALSDDLVPAFGTFSEEMFYSAFDERELLESLLTSVDKPSGKDGRVYNDRYIELYQFSEYLSMDPRTPNRLRSAALGIMDTEDEVIIHRRAGANHPPASRLMGIYFPVDMDDPDYAELVIGKTTAWDDAVRLFVREMDARPDPLNWTQERPPQIDFVLRTSTPELITGVTVEMVDGGTSYDLTLTGSGGLFTGTHSSGDGLELRYRFRVASIYGGSVDFPPDGFSVIRFEAEAQPPEVWHEPPVVINIGPNSGGLIFYIRDSTGIEMTRPENVPRLEYREKGKTAWYSKPLVEMNGGSFNGWHTFSETPTGMTPGARILYRVIVEDVLGNSATYPEEGFWESTMGVGARFFLDGRHSDISGFGQLIKEFGELGMVVETGLEDDGLEELSTYKGYIILMPAAPIPPARVQAIEEFVMEGGELLLILDPTDAQQLSKASLLLEGLDVIPTSEGGVTGFFPSNSYSELGGGLPTVSGMSNGSFELSSGQTAVYYTEPPMASMYTDWYGFGRIVVSHPDLLDDGVLVRDANRQLADRVIGYLHENIRPVVRVQVTPPAVATPGQVVTFNLSGSFDPDGEIVQYSLSLSDSTYLESPDPVFQHIFDSTGTFTVLLKAYDKEGEVGSLTVSIKINRAPTTDIGISSIRVYAGDEVTFTYKGMDPDGDEFIVEWDFGDGFKVSGLLVRHSYKRRGEFTYTVVVRDSNGLEAQRSGVLTVLNSEPSALIDRDNILVNGGPANFSGDLKVTLYAFEGDRIRIPGDLSYDPDQNDLLNFTWDMGDGKKLYDQIAIHRFLSSGLIGVTLTVSDGVGGSDTTELFVNVANREPFAAFEYRDEDGKVLFDASLSTDDPWDVGSLQYRWDFGDGESEVTLEPRVVHDYTFGGRYTVKLTVVDGDGASDTFKQEISASGIGLGAVVAMVVVIIVVVAVIGILVWRRLHERMVREDKGLLEVLGMRVVEKETPYDGRPGSFRRPVRPERERRARPHRERPTHGMEPRRRPRREALPPAPMRRGPRRGGDD
ncbi:MAG: PKD domain-containing protein [Thermoplasmatota archaeon]